uniref:Growth inhibition and differentiation-related protein 88 n=1 Tax=Bactrocera latifrons TaxID=174628 RepID=A0A0K8VPK9_BACLA
MGVEKNGSETRLFKTNSLDLYRPPALRNYNQSGASPDGVAAAYNLSAAAAERTTTATDKDTLLSTSISCNNSPTHANENNSFDNNAMTSRCVNEDYGTTKTTTTSISVIKSEAPTSCGGMETAPTTTAAVSSKSGQQRQSSAVRRERRPDRAVYIPRARRSQTTPPTTPTTTAVEVTRLQQKHSKTNDTAPSATSLAPTPTTTACNNNSCGGSNKQRLAITSETRASVQTAAPTKLDDTSGNKSACIAVVCMGKKTKSSTVNNRERRERSKKSTLSVEAQDAKISKLSSERTETKTIRNLHDSITHTDSLDSTAVLISQQKQPHLNSDNLPNLLLMEQQPTEELKIAPETIVNNEMNTNSSRRSKIKQSNTENASKVQNLRIEDVASTENGTRSTTKCDAEAQEFQRASKEINRSNRRIIKQTFVSDVLEIPEKIENGKENDKESSRKSPNNIPISTPHRSAVDSTTEEEEEDDWETMYDDSGECLDPKIMQELTASVGKVKIELPKMDYSAYLTKQSILNDEEFPHVLEVSNFPVEFKNHDLLMVFSQYKESGFDIKWVDDTHALAVFSSSRIAAEVLTMGHPFVVLKPLAEATIESRLKAKKCAASLQPYRQRPETCAALARRLVTGALGVRLKTAAAERENEKRVLREAKGKFCIYFQSLIRVEFYIFVSLKYFRT